MEPDRLDASRRRAQQLLHTALENADFQVRMRRRARVWETDYDALMDDVRRVLFVALHATHDRAGEDPDRHAQAALEVLASCQPELLFVSLPAQDREQLEPAIQRLWLMSVSLTGRSSLRWLRLVKTAKEVLTGPGGRPCPLADSPPAPGPDDQKTTVTQISVSWTTDDPSTTVRPAARAARVNPVP
ncbi:hypothetical protein ABT160_43680 [Streptomyces sp. NPDC001941]|uniref:hypothetical protein n=1 Tax=Streptomyces sp. NPDC001941 TaxID=3154659 RepID=UPI00332C93F9